MPDAHDEQQAQQSADSAGSGNSNDTGGTGHTPQPQLVHIPPDLALVSDGDLVALEGAAKAEFERVRAGVVSPETVQHAMRLADGIDRMRAESEVREARRQTEAERQAAQLSEQMEALSTRVGGSEGDGAPPVRISQTVDAEAIAAAAARGVAAVMTAALGERAVGQDLARVSTSLADARRHAPATVVPARDPLMVTASVDIPGRGAGDRLDFDSLVDAFQKKARSLPIGNSGRADSGPMVATIRNHFEHTVDDRTSPSQTEELIRFLTTKEKQEALVAGGGWCAPSEIRYDFFNIACEDGMIDLPTFGVSRGGIRFPVSPSLADANLAPYAVPMSAGSNPWLWTETDDVATVTGSPNKPCIRVPCPTFSEARLECYGICLTAGNLTDDAYPEATQNFLRLLMAAHAHAMNQRFIATMETLSAAVVSGGDFVPPSANADPVTQVLGGIELAATDYRERFGMCYDDVLEVVVPRWVQSILRAALRHRQGVDLISEADSIIRRYFAALNVRAQFVGDWQVRGAGQFGTATAMTAWPTSADIMVYAAGTFVLGNGLTLDLGVVRDSVLNAENDHTAAWSEECHLIARVGHESRRYRIHFSVGKTTAPAAIDGTAAL